MKSEAARTWRTCAPLTGLLCGCFIRLAVAGIGSFVVPGGFILITLSQKRISLTGARARKISDSLHYEQASNPMSGSLEDEDVVGVSIRGIADFHLDLGSAWVS